MIRARFALLAMFVLLVVVLPASAAASVMTPSGVRDDSAFTTAGGVYAEGPAGAGKYAWYVDQQSDQAILRGFDQSNPANPAQLAEVNGRVGDGNGRIGSVGGVAFQPGSNTLLVLDRTYDRLIAYPRKNDGSSADPVSYGGGNTKHFFSPWNYLFPWWSELDSPGGLAVDTGDTSSAGHVYISDTGNARVIALDNQFHSILDHAEPSWGDSVKPGALAVDPGNGHIFVSIEGAARIDVFTRDFGTRLQPLSSPSAGDFISLSVEPVSNRLFAAKKNELDVFSLTTGTLLGSVANIAFDSKLLGISTVANSRNLHLASSGDDHAQAFQLFAPPTCSVPATGLAVSDGHSVTITPSCDDTDHSTLKEFSVENSPARGTATLAADRKSITYAATAGASGNDSVKFKVMTQDGLSQAYEYPVVVVKDPTVTISSPTAGAELGSPVTAAFSATNASTVTCKWDGEAAITPCASPLGPQTLTAGGHALKVTATNLAGVSVSATRNFTVIAPPTVAIDSPSEAEIVGSPEAASFTLGGGVAASVTCKWDSDEAGPCVSPLAPETLTPGAHSLTVSVSNVGGSASATRNFVVLAPPTVSIDTPTDGEEVGSPVAPTFTLGGGAAASVTCAIDDGDAIDPCTSPLEAADLEPGDHSLTVTATNVGGTDTRTRNFTVLAVPTIAIDTPTEDEAVGSPVAPTFTLNGDAADTVTCQFDDEEAIDPCTSPVDAADLEPGAHSFTVTATNVAGTNSATRDFTVIAEPTVSITSPTDEEEVGSPVTPEFTLGGGEADTVTCQIDDEEAIDPCTSPLEPAELEPGDHTLTVTAKNVGGTATATRDFTVVEPPVVSITAPANVQVVGSPAIATFTIEGSSPENVSCQWDDEPVIKPCASPQGPKTLSPGPHTFKVTATNPAEEVSVTSKFTITAAQVQAAAAEIPVVHETTNLQLDSGDVWVKIPGSNDFVKLTKDMLVPIGTLIDATSGTAHLTLANKDKSLYDGKFWGGVFQVLQGTGDNPIATMKLRDGFGVQAGTARAADAMIATRSPGDLERGFKAWTSRKRGKKKGGLWGDAHGNFRTSGNGGSASVRGTRWYVANYENGTLFKVARGTVTITPLHCSAHPLTAGHSEFIYLENSHKKKKDRKHPLKRKC